MNTADRETVTVDGHEYSILIYVDDSPSNPYEEFEPLSSLVINGGREYIDAEYGALSTVVLAAVKAGYSNAAIARWLRLKGATGIHEVYRGAQGEVHARAVDGRTLETERYARGSWSVPGAIYRTDGFAFLAPGKAKAAYTDLGYPDKSADLVGAEVAEYSAWAAGEVYFYIAETETGEQVGSCGGFYGWDNEKSGLIESATDEINAHAAEQREGTALAGAGFVGII